MLEGIAAWVLNTYIGEYLENLNTDQLSIGILQGALELENLPLKKSALNHLGLPLQVKSGYVGRITLKVPVRKIKSEPWVISLDNVYLVAGPVTPDRYDEAKEKEREEQSKKAQLDALESKWQMQHKGVQQGTSWFSYATSLGTNIIENLQLNINNVHLRYEDDITIPGNSFACGIVIKGLSAQSTDHNWVSHFVHHNQSETMHKLVDLKDFSVYWDPDAQLVGDLPRAEMTDMLRRGVCLSESTQQFKEHEYILEPVSAQAKMKRFTTPLPLRNPNNPRILLDIQLESIPVTLTNQQHKGVILWLKEFDRFEKLLKYRKWKPTAKVKKKALLYWWFAIKCVLVEIQEKNRHRTKEYMHQRARDNVSYVKSYTEYLVSGTDEESSKTLRNQMENQLSFDEIRILREVAMEQAAKQISSKQTPVQVVEQSSTDQQQQRGIWQRWWGWYGYSSPQDIQLSQEDLAFEPTDESNSETLIPPAETASELDQEVMDMLTESEENNTLLRRDAVFLNVNFCLKSGTFKLFSSQDGEKTSIIGVECSTVEMNFESRPRYNAYKFGINVGSIRVTDMFTKGSLFPVILAPQKKDRGISLAQGNLNLVAVQETTNANEETLFSLTYEKKPKDSIADHRLSIITKPLEMFYNPAAMERIRAFFSRKHVLPSRHSELKLASAAKSRYEQLKNQTKAGIQHTWEQMLEGEEKLQRRRWAINLDISAPKIHVPENFTDPNTTIVIFNFGHLTFRNIGPAGYNFDLKRDDSEDNFATPSSTPEETTVEESPSLTELFSGNFPEIAIKNKIYDKYSLNLSDLQVMVGRAKDNWRQSHFKGAGRLHLVDRFNISVQFERRLVYTTDPQFPATSLSGSLPELVIHVNEQKIQALRMCMGLLMDPARTTQNSAPNQNVHDYTRPHASSRAGLSETDSAGRVINEESRLLLTNFSINQLKLEIQSRGRPVAELQVSGAKANFTKRPYDSAMSLTVHSLLVVDAIQTYGSDFELLVASHRLIR
ncbi:intermembrane lipid transfer protein VPS13D-like [Tubulanus polymorphus]|uniref:intermembrane lipid transfer protein VPS13D-like n=1 Tax=Tubulanus polymorphus TaxID=672921 RepID=UPI003DA2A873